MLAPPLAAACCLGACFGVQHSHEPPVVLQSQELSPDVLPARDTVVELAAVVGEGVRAPAVSTAGSTVEVSEVEQET